MADMLRKHAPVDGRTTCGCSLCVNRKERRTERKRARRREQREWRRDTEAGYYSTPDDDWGYADEDWLNAAGNYAAYLAQPTEARDPYAPYGQPHYRPLEREDHERDEAYKNRMAERVKRIREERHNA